MLPELSAAARGLSRQLPYDGGEGGGGGDGGGSKQAPSWLNATVYCVVAGSKQLIVALLVCADAGEILQSVYVPSFDFVLHVHAEQPLGGGHSGLSLLASLAVSMLPVVASMKHVVLCSPYFMSVEQSRKPKPHEGLDVTRQEHGMHPSGIAHEPPLPPLAQEGAFLCNITPPVVLTS